MRTRRGSLLLVAALASACARDDGRPASTACTAPTTEDVDPASGVHVLRPDQVVFDDLTPTSGPHLSVAAPTGVLRSTAAGAAQVTVLEQGGAVVSIRTGRSELFVAAESLVVDRVLLHPVDGLPEPVVVTAWRSRISCSDIDADYISWFIAERTAAPDHHS